MRFTNQAILLLLTSCAAFACAATTDGDDTVDAGDGDGTGGTTSGIGGTTGNTGGSLGSGGTVGGVGGSTPVACIVAGTTSPVIADFTTLVDGKPVVNEVDGRKGVFITTPVTGASQDASSGALVAQTTSGSWGTVGLTIADGTCYDASSYGGIKFTLSSTAVAAEDPKPALPANTSLKFALTTNETTASVDGGLCTGECSNHPSVVFTVTGAEQCFTWAQILPADWGDGVAPSVPAKAIRGFAWGVNAQTELLNVTLDNIEFVASCP